MQVANKMTEGLSKRAAPTASPEASSSGQHFKIPKHTGAVAVHPGKIGKAGRREMRAKATIPMTIGENNTTGRSQTGGKVIRKRSSASAAAAAAKRKQSTTNGSSGPSQGPSTAAASQKMKAKSAAPAVFHEEPSITSSQRISSKFPKRTVKQEATGSELLTWDEVEEAVRKQFQAG